MDKKYRRVRVTTIIEDDEIAHKISHAVIFNTVSKIIEFSDGKTHYLRFTFKEGGFGIYPRKTAYVNKVIN